MAGKIYVAKDSLGLARYVEEQYLDGKKGVLLLGERGIGKTEFAKYIARIIFEKYYGRVALGINKPTREAIEEAVSRLGRNASSLAKHIEEATGIPKETKAVYNIVRYILAALKGDVKIETVSNVIKSHVSNLKQFYGISYPSYAEEIAEVEENPAEVIYRYLREHSYFVINASQTLPEDLHWIFPDKERGEVIHVPLPIPPYSVVIIDEITNARPEMLSFLLTFVLNKAIGNHKYEGIFFIATGNRPSQSELASALPVPMLERFAIIDFPFPGRKALTISMAEQQAREARRRQVRQDFNQLIALFDTILPYGTGGWREVVLHALYNIVNSELDFESANLPYISVLKPYSEEYKSAMVRLPSPRSWEQFVSFAITHLKERNGYIDPNVLKLEFQSTVLTNKDEADKFVDTFIKNVEQLRVNISNYAKVELEKQKIAMGMKEVNESVLEESPTPLLDAYSAVKENANPEYISYVFKKRYIIEENEYAKSLASRVSDVYKTISLELEESNFEVNLSSISSFVISFDTVEVEEEIKQEVREEKPKRKKPTIEEIFARIYQEL